tara:strand:- start:903 stop:2363 length:1461 start_codon:yes stop_codon:yes gene_type:complete
MKNIVIKIFILIVGATVSFSCNELLEEEVPSAIGPTTFYQSAEDIENVLNHAYRADHEQGGLMTWVQVFDEASTDIMYQYGGGLNNHIKLYLNFTWDAGHVWLNNAWQDYYESISSANVAIAQIPDVPINEQVQNALMAEARFIRANIYFKLYDLWGPVPIITDPETDPLNNPTRPTEEAFLSFVEEDYLASLEHLPATRPGDEYGRVTKGGALGMLASFYLNTRQWDKAAARAKEVMDMGLYDLFEVSVRTDLFDISNERNSEFIYVRPYTQVSGYSHNYFPRVLPPNYKLKFPPNENFGAQYTVYDDWYNTFDPADERREAIITSYVDNNDQTIALNTTPNNYRNLKIMEDPNASDRHAGNDIPKMRYADILLIRAEALNELEGVNQESVDLINEVRVIAGVTPYDLIDFADKAEFRDAILDERGWEFSFENKRRSDLIRHNKFISSAQSRGVNAQSHHVRYPIPQPQIDVNPDLKQNPGYGGE